MWRLLRRKYVDVGISEKRVGEESVRHIDSPRKELGIHSLVYEIGAIHTRTKVDTTAMNAISVDDNKLRRRRAATLRLRTWLPLVTQPTNIAQVYEIGSHEILPIPYLNPMEWEMEVLGDDACLA